MLLRLRDTGGPLISARLVILFLLLSIPVVAAEVYPFQLRVERNTTPGIQQIVCVDPQSSRIVSLNASISPSNLSLSTTIDGKIIQTTVDADSVVFASWNGSAWNLVLARESILTASVITKSGWRNLGPLGSLVDVVSLCRRRSELTLCTRDSILMLQPRSSGNGFIVHSVYSFPRSPLHACRSGSEVFAINRLSENVVTIDRYAGGTWSSPVAMSAWNNIADVSSILAASIAKTDAGYSIEIHDLGSPSKHSTVSIPTVLVEPRRIEVFHDTIVAVFANGVVVAGSNGILAASLENADYQDVSFVDYRNGILCISDRNASTMMLISKDMWYRLRVVVNSVWMIAPWLFGVLVFVVLLLRMLSYQRLLRDVLEHTSRGISFVVDRNMKLRRINNRGRELFSMELDTPLRSTLSFYCHSEMHFEIERFVASALVSRTFSTHTYVVPVGSGVQEILFSAQPVFGLTGSFGGLVISGVDITEELERKRLVNWAQLAHDMQTNLSVIRLNAEQMDTTDASMLFLDQRRRIIHQSKLLLQRVRDIVSIGRDDVLHAEETDVREFFLSVVHEFDDASFGDVDFIVASKSIRLRIDSSKLSRAIRNAVENALRALPDKKGTVELGYRITTEHITLFVRDTGSGMDEQTRLNFFRPFFSTYRQYGGTGIGTMIMQRAVTLHKGYIALESELGAGTTVYFHLPRDVYAG